MYRGAVQGTCAPMQDLRESDSAPGNAWLHHAAASNKAMAWLLLLLWQLTLSFLCVYRLTCVCVSYATLRVTL